MKVNDEQIESMKNFIFAVMEDWQEGGGIEGYDLQEIAEKHGILIPHTVYAPCGDYCNCVECYNDDEFRGGVPCYTFPDWLTRVAEQRDAPVHAEHKCPRCNGRGKVRSMSNSDVKCPMCNGAGIYNRSAGG